MIKEPKNKGHKNFYEGWNLKKKYTYYLTAFMIEETIKIQESIIFLAYVKKCQDSLGMQ